MMADRDKTMRLLKTARGQIEGIMKMVEEDRYCVDISTQLMATQSLIGRINADVTALLRDPDFAARMLLMGGTPAPQTPAEAAAFVRAEIAKWRAVAEGANVRLEG